jgi:hypothetical protein
MLSNPLHRFSPYHTIPSTTLLSNGHVPNGHLHAGLDTLAQGSHYALQQLQQHVGVHNPHLARAGPQQKHRQHPYGPAARATGAAGPIRRRISRACDQCNQLRTKCDGQHPCAHCIEFGLGCEYIRERKKRGKASRKDLAQQAAAQAAAAAQSNGKTEGGENQSSENRSDSNGNSKAISGDQQSNNDKMSEMADESMRSQRTGSMDSLGDMGHPSHMTSHPGAMDRDHLDSPGPLDLNGYGNVHPAYDRQPMGGHMMNGGGHAPYGSNQGNMSSYPDLPYALQTQSPTGYSANASNSFRLGTSPLSAYPMGAETTSPGWMNMSSPPPQFASHMPASGYGHSQSRYPVLEPLLPHLGNMIPVSLACDLIDLYFASSSSAQMHPMSPYVLGANQPS